MPLPSSAAAAPTWITNARRVMPWSMMPSPVRTVVRAGHPRAQKRPTARLYEGARGRTRTVSSPHEAVATRFSRRPRTDRARCEPARGDRPEEAERQPEPEALPLTRAAAQRVQDEAVAGRGLAARGEELTQPLLLLFAELRASPLHVLLESLEPAELGRAAGETFAAVPPGLALAGGEEGELDKRERVLEPVQPVMVHAGEGREE